MNYAKIYEDLIESRKMRPKLEGEYYESHHILPRCMGGGDSKSNLVYLTAEDHFMAHMLLAKAYGGKLWFAAQSMMRVPKGSKRIIRHRRMHAIVRKGLSNLNHDPIIREYRVNSTGENFLATRQQLKDMYGISLSLSKVLVAGKAPSIHGISLASTPPKPKFDFVRIATGEVFHMTVSEAVQHFKLARKGLYQLSTGENLKHKGYCLLENKERVDSTRPEFKEIATGEIFRANYPEMYERSGMPYFAYRRLVKGWSKIIQGYSLVN